MPSNHSIKPASDHCHDHEPQHNVVVTHMYLMMALYSAVELG
jgi:hypothetical protein